MPTRKRILAERERAAAAEELNRQFGPPPLWVKQLMQNPGYRGNLWGLFHPSIRDQAKTPEALIRQREGQQKGLATCLTRNEQKKRDALALALKMADKFPYWRERGAAGKIANKVGDNIRRIQRLIKRLKKNATSS